MTRQHGRGEPETLHSGSDMETQAKHHLVAGCLRAAAESGMTDNQIFEKGEIPLRTVKRLTAKMQAGEPLRPAC